MSDPILVNVTEEIVRGLVSFYYEDQNIKHFVNAKSVNSTRWHLH